MGDSDHGHALLGEEPHGVEHAQTHAARVSLLKALEDRQEIAQRNDEDDLAGS